jgi:hypothetical protein
MRIFANNVEDLIIAIGARLLPAFNSVLQFFNDLLGSTDRGTAAIAKYNNATSDLVKANFELEKAIQDGDKALIEQAKIFKNQAVGKQALALLELQRANRENNREIEEGTKALAKGAKQRDETNRIIASERKELNRLIELRKTESKVVQTIQFQTQNGLQTKRVEIDINAAIGEQQQKLLELQENVNESNEQAAELEGKKNTQKQLALTLDKQTQASQEKGLELQLKIGEQKAADAEADELEREKREEDAIGGFDRSFEAFNSRREQAQSFTEQGLSDLQGLFDEFADNRRIQLANEVKDLQDARAAGLITEEQFISKRQELDRKAAAQKTKDAKRQKVFRIIESELNNLTAVGNTVASIPNFPANVIAGGVVETLGHIRTAAIAAKPIPKFADGGVISDVGEAQIPGEDGIVAVRRGESVLNQQVTAELGEDAIDKLNAGGGISPNVNITVQNGEGAVETLNDYFRQFGGARELTTG